MAYENDDNDDISAARVNAEHIVPYILSAAQLVRGLGDRTQSIQTVLGDDGMPKVVDAWRQVAESIALVLPQIPGIEYKLVAGGEENSGPAAEESNS
jgi:hypothetical protein